MRSTPLLKLHQQAEASLLPYGQDASEPILMVETFGELELEYAALRKSCILIDEPHRAVIEVTGADRLDFLNRMVTQELKGLVPWQLRRSFWLNRKGRIDADLRIAELDDRTVLELDSLALQRTLDGLTSFIIAEDVALRDISEQTHRLALHGPTAIPLLQAVSHPAEGAPNLSDLQDAHATRITIGGHDVTVLRDDGAGEVGLELIIPAPSTLAIYTRLIETGQEHDGNGNGGGHGGGPARFRLRPAGWHAFNIARIEAGTPLYNIDFGPSSLPHETGIIHSRVSFKKGCYLGQEVVARMESRGHSKGRICALRFTLDQPPTPDDPPPLPVAGVHVFRADAPESDPVGVITSSTLSPMLGQQPIAFAMLRHDSTAPGTLLRVAADGTFVHGAVQGSLASWTRNG
jgi:tRNA-modifying protein YgfZ